MSVCSVFFTRKLPDVSHLLQINSSISQRFNRFVLKFTHTPNTPLPPQEEIFCGVISFSFSSCSFSLLS